MARILAISDSHYGFPTKEEIGIINNRIDDVNPDIITLTGDMSFGIALAISQKAATLKRPVLAVTGNHDHYSLSQISGIIDMNRRVIKRSGLTIAGFGYLDFDNKQYVDADDEGNKRVFRKEDYSPENDYSWAVDNMVLPDKSIGEIPSLDLLLSHASTFGDYDSNHQSPKTLTRLIYSSKAPRVSLHGHWHINGEERIRNPKGMTRVIKVHTPRPFSRDTFGKIIEIPTTGSANHSIKQEVINV